MNMFKCRLNKYNFSSWIVALAAIASIVQMQKSNLTNIAESKLDYESYIKAESVERANISLLATMPSFGFNNLIADWAVLRFLQYFGDTEARQATDYSLSTEFFKTVVKHDPNFTSAYFRLAPAVTLKAARPEETVSILEEGLSQISPERYRANYLWVYKAIDELLFLGDTQAAIKSFQTAAEWSSMINDTPREESARRTAQFLANDPDSKTVQVGAWFTVWTGAPDIETRNLAQQNIERLGGRLEIREDGRVFAHPPQEEKG